MRYRIEVKNEGLRDRYVFFVTTKERHPKVDGELEQKIRSGMWRGDELVKVSEAEPATEQVAA